ncbi:hypothetical protein CN918_26820 [Priestia megaterium]|nr:hypothetical protein CN918_26820 [Priestia megaterium]
MKKRNIVAAILGIVYLILVAFVLYKTEIIEDNLFNRTYAVYELLSYNAYSWISVALKMGIFLYVLLFLLRVIFVKSTNIQLWVIRITAIVNILFIQSLIVWEVLATEPKIEFNHTFFLYTLLVIGIGESIYYEVIHKKETNNLTSSLNRNIALIIIVLTAMMVTIKPVYQIEIKRQHYYEGGNFMPGEFHYEYKTAKTFGDFPLFPLVPMLLIGKFILIIYRCNNGVLTKLFDAILIIVLLLSIAAGANYLFPQIKFMPGVPFVYWSLFILILTEWLVLLKVKK